MVQPSAIYWDVRCNVAVQMKNEECTGTVVQQAVSALYQRSKAAPKMRNEECQMATKMHQIATNVTNIFLLATR